MRSFHLTTKMTARIYIFSVWDNFLTISHIRFQQPLGQ